MAFCFRRVASTTYRMCDAGGVLEKSGMVEVVSSLERDGRPVFRDLRWGVYVVIEAPNDYAALFPAIRPQDGCEWALCRDVQALSPDRHGAKHFGVIGSVTP
jgi:hypothetical protein